MDLAKYSPVTVPLRDRMTLRILVPRDLAEWYSLRLAECEVLDTYDDADRRVAVLAENLEEISAIWTTTAARRPSMLDAWAVYFRVVGVADEMVVLGYDLARDAPYVRMQWQARKPSAT